jgi:hypothetical protein
MQIRLKIKGEKARAYITAKCAMPALLQYAPVHYSFHVQKTIDLTNDLRDISYE